MKGLKRTIYSIVFIIALLVLSSCAQCNQTGQSPMINSSHNMTLTEKDNGTQVQVTHGDIVKLRLEANPSTGYSWQITENNPELLKPLGKPEYEESEHTLIGQVEHQIFRFKAVSPGTAMLKLLYYREWEKGKAPEKSYRVTVEIR
ncbi:MAG: protease inhibitor I42 family protein [Deltaproteobacteria bacterium]|nr:protease inhibitor I42 family protein [Deltaproteobacteria bacterium]